VSVSSGASLVLQNSTVLRSVRVLGGGSFSAHGATIGQSIGAFSPQTFMLCGSTVRGSIMVTGALSPVVMGAPACAPNTISGGILVTP
jgi:hypothetical protein